MAKPDLRQSFTVEAHVGMTADEVFSACVPAIFKLYAYDYKNNILGIGSGVVLSARGDAVTCGHLVNGVYRLVAEMYDGTKREVTIYSFDADADIAHIRVVGSTLPYLGVTTEVEEGDTVYALGYPGRRRRNGYDRQGDRPGKRRLPCTDDRKHGAGHQRQLRRCAHQR